MKEMGSGTRNILAIVLSMGVLLIWYTFIAPPPKPQRPPQTAPAASTEIVTTASTTAASGSTAPLLTMETKSLRKQGKKILLENEKARLFIDTNGGVIAGWELKEYKRHETKEDGFVTLAENQGTILATSFSSKQFSIEEPLFFQVVRSTETEISLQAEWRDQTIIKNFRLPPDSYELEMEVEWKNRGNQTIAFVPSVEWGKIPHEESPQRGVLFFKSPPDRWHPVYYQDGALKDLARSKLPASKRDSGDIRWIGAQSRYFLSGVIPEGSAGQAIEVGSYALENGEQYFYEKLIFPPTQVMTHESWVQKFKIYGGPKDLSQLNQMGSGMEQTVGYGWTKLLAIPILHLLQFFYKIIHNYGLSIIILTVFIKLLLNPINRKAMKSMKAMQALQPRLKEIREKYQDDKQKLNLEMMQLFKAHKINPMGGCLPMALQFPIYIALYKVLWGSVELYHAPFFWFYKDLSAPDPYLVMPVILGIAMLVQTKLTPSASADPAQQKMMMLMPLMFCVFMVFLPMGLCLYILVNTLMTILQQWMYQHDIRFRDLVRGRA